MLDDFETSYLDLDASFLHAHDYDCNISISDNPTANANTLSTSVTDMKSFTTGQNSNVPNAMLSQGFYNSKFKPIVDDGLEYRYEDNPALYRKIRKLGN